jgi:glycosyltransferase involved in cell wall biosynthesis
MLHLFKPKGYSGLAALLARQLYPTVPLIVDTDDWEGWGGWNDLLPYPRLAKSVFAWQERDLPRRANAVTVASRTLETQIWGFGVPPAQVFYLPNGVLQPEDAQQTRNPVTRATGTTPHQPTLLLYTRFWEFDLRDLIAALVAVVAQVPTVRLLVVGRGERGEEGELLRLARRAGIARAIDYRGWVEPQEIPALLAAADIALVPLDDTLINRARCSVKLLELMAAGLPVVAGRVGQVSEYIEDRQSGLLVPSGDPAALARATLLLLEDADLRLRIGAAARVAVSAFTWEQLAPVAEQAYDYSYGSIS